MKTFYWVEVTHNNLKLDVCKLYDGSCFIDKGIFLTNPDEMLDPILDSDTCSAIYRNAQKLVANKLKQETPIPYLSITSSESDTPPF
jgi:hypothetical protein